MWITQDREADAHLRSRRCPAFGHTQRAIIKCTVLRFYALVAAERLGSIHGNVLLTTRSKVADALRRGLRRRPAGTSRGKGVPHRLVAFTFISATELESTIGLPAGAATVEVGILNPNAAQSSPVTRALAVPPLPLASLTESARLLDQTTFGPTLYAAQHVQLVATAAYLNEQFATPTTRMPAIPAPPVALCPDATFRCAQSSFWKNALTANDQLRQRVAFALSEIFVGRW